VHPYVSRGGIKLEHGLREFDVSLSEKVAVDIGASTGGFTDCLLQHGIEKVFAVDVGYGQLDWKLQSDSRVVSLDRKNARELNSSDINELVDLVVIDVSSRYRCLFYIVKNYNSLCNQCFETSGRFNSAG